MSDGAEPLVVCINHPAEVDAESLRSELENTPRPIDLRIHPFKENLKVRLARRTPPVPGDLLESTPRPDSSLRETWKHTEVLLALDLPEELLGDLPRLRWVQAFSAGTEHLPVKALYERGVSLTTAAGAGAGAIAEFVIGRLIEVFREFRHIDAMQRERKFHRPAGRTLAGRTLGVVGLGAIGSAVAKRARAFGMRVIATRRSAGKGAKSPLVDDLFAPEALPQLLGASDVVVLAAPATAETQDLINDAAFERMRPGAVLCNVARGALVDEDALLRALESGRLGAAILDVTREEPLPADHPLWNAPRLYLSPHCSIPPDAYDERVVALFAENLRRYAAEEPLRNLVTGS
ncbi:MAG: D-2-hydroxyacid dehydrogenase [Myxococcales bacterium]|nr:D-2-hydroxyacid dehydrogenase [Myxococcales bacterium]